MELAALITAIATAGAFAFGLFVGKRIYSDEIARLTQQNASLLGSVYHRIGYKPPVEPVAKPVAPLTEIPQSELPMPDEVSEATKDATYPRKPAQPLPDLFARQREALEKDKKNAAGIMLRPNA